MSWQRVGGDWGTGEDTEGRETKDQLAKEAKDEQGRSYRLTGTSGTPCTGGDVDSTGGDVDSAGGDVDSTGGDVDSMCGDEDSAGVPQSSY